jgi:antitoxin ChpS
MKSKQTWQVTLIDAGDGSGDAILNFPDEMMTLMGWVIGDTLFIEVINNCIKVTKINNNQ